MEKKRFVALSALIAIIAGLLFTVSGVCYASPLMWQEGGIPIRQGSHIWWSGVTENMGEDKVLVIWSDTRSGGRLLMAQLYDENGSIWEEEVVIGRQIVWERNQPERSPGERCPHWATVQDAPVTVRASDGNVIIAWNEANYLTNYEDYGSLRINKISEEGELLWGEGFNLPESKSRQLSLQMIADDEGGAYIAWVRHTSLNNHHVHGIHINSLGEPYAEEWNEEAGLLLAGNGGSDYHLSIITDGENGIILAVSYYLTRVIYTALKRISAPGEIIWERDYAAGGTYYTKISIERIDEELFGFAYIDGRDGRSKVYVNLIDINGEDVWEAPLPVDAEAHGLPYNDNNLKITATTDNGLVVSWRSDQELIPGLYAAKFDLEGNRLWGERGKLISRGSNFDWKYLLENNNVGGARLVWSTDSPNSNHYDIYLQDVDADGELVWGADGIRVTDVVGKAFSPAINRVEDNLFVFWADERGGSVSMYYQIYDTDMEQLFADNGELIFDGLSESAYKHNIVRNGDYVYIVWVDERYGNYGSRIMVQKMDLEGNLYFAENGIPITVETGSHQVAGFVTGFGREVINSVSHHSGGIAVTWIEQRNDNELVYAQAISPNGEMLWGDKGLRVSVTDDVYTQDNPIISRRGNEYVVVYDETNPGADWSYIRDIKAQKIVDGNLAWGDEGVVIAWQFGNYQIDHVVREVIDGEYIIWTRGGEWGQEREATIYAKRIDEDGNAAEGWDEYGVVVVDYPGFTQIRPRALLTDEGIVVLWEDRRTAPGQQENMSIYGQLISPEGEIQWAENGIPIADYLNDQSMITAQYDDGYVYLAWRDNRNHQRYSDIAFQKTDLQGNRLWGEPAPFAVQNITMEYDSPVIHKSGETLLVVWESVYRESSELSMQLASAQTGEKFWGDEGLQLAGYGGGNLYPVTVSADNNEAIVVWADGRSSDRYWILNLYAQKIDMYTELAVGEDIIIPQQRMELYANYPNPFNPDTNIAFNLPVSEKVSLKIFNVKGQLVRTLLDQEYLQEGRHNVVWNGKDDAGKISGSGLFFYRLAGERESFTRRMVLVK